MMHIIIEINPVNIAINFGLFMQQNCLVNLLVLKYDIH